MKIRKEAQQITQLVYQSRIEGQTIGLVPTMGALHAGHLSLIKKAKSTCDKVVCSVFVNPTQFDNQEDLSNYPVTLEEDLALLESISCDYVFTPSIDEIYPEQVSTTSYNFGGIENEMEGDYRPGHFDGVATVVERLFRIICPQAAFFGEKDFQQLQIIKQLTQMKKIPVQIIACPIYRETDGLAMSSRNRRLTKTARKQVPIIYKTLKEVKQKIKSEPVDKISKYVTDLFEQSPLKLDYFVIADAQRLRTAQVIRPEKKYRAFIAAFAENVRLIDNIAL